MADLIENLCEATQIIVDKAIEELKFDKTVTGKIIDNSKANTGEYTVKEGTVEYNAYSENTSYKIDDAVYVTIPNGDYSEQKLITGKVITKEETYIISNSLNSFLNITGNLVLDETAIGRLIANHTDISKQEVLIDSQMFDENAVANFSRLAISADIKTNLNAWKIKEGKYGLRIDISTYPNNEVKTLNFSNKNMFGDVYNFTTFQTQTMIFDISSINNIKSISISFYQEENSFKTKDGELIPFKDDMGFDIAPNLLLKNISLSLGYDKSEFEIGVDKVLLSCNDSKVYNNILEEEYYRSIKLTWVHWDEQNNLYPITSETNDFDFDIRWYRYRLSASALEELTTAYKTETGVFETDEIQQINQHIELLQEQINNLLNNNADEEGNLNSTDIIILDDYVNQIENLNQEKTILCNQIFRDEQGNLISDAYMDNNWEYQDIYTQLFNYYFLPYANREEEQIVALIIQYDEEGNKTVYKSEPLVFKNANPVLENSSAKSGLKLTFMDETEGNYFIYNKNNRITDLRESTKIRTIKVDLVQNTGLETSLLDENCVINWTYPENDQNTMIQVIEVNNTELTYRIKETYSSWQVENTIACEIIKDGESFYGAQSLNFGIAGTNGSDATLVINFTNNKRILESNESFYYQRAIQAHSIEGAQFKLELFNSKGKLVELGEHCNVIWSLEGRDGDWDVSTDITQEGNSELPILWGGNSDVILIPPPQGFNIDDHLILVATVTGYTNYPLITKFPIPITANVEDFNYINGPTEVIYSTTGYPIAFDTPYKLFTCGNAVHSNIQWSISNAGKYTGTLINNILQPLVIYMPNAPKYGVLATQDGVPVWYQPILIMQNAYGSTTLNNWDGKQIELNENEGTIVAPAIAAGKKEEDNSFSGIMMGDWSVSDTSQEISAQTGLYGFNKGAVSFAFTDDGKGFIGKAGRGRIEFDGDQSVIKNSGYEDADGNGMLIDLDDPYISLKRNGREVILINSKTSTTRTVNGDTLGNITDFEDLDNYQHQPYFKITDYEKNPLIYIGEDHFYLASARYLTTIASGEGTVDNIINIKNDPYNVGNLQQINGTYLDLNEGFFLTKWGILGNFYFDPMGISSVAKIVSVENSSNLTSQTKVFLPGGEDQIKGLIISSGHIDDETSPYKNPGIYTAAVDIYNEYFNCRGYANFYGPTTFKGSVETELGIYNFITFAEITGTGTIGSGKTSITFSGNNSIDGYDCVGISSLCLTSSSLKVSTFETNSSGDYSIVVTRHPITSSSMSVTIKFTLLYIKTGAKPTPSYANITGIDGGEAKPLPRPWAGGESTGDYEDTSNEYDELSRAITDLQADIKANAEEIQTINNILEVDYQYYTSSTGLVLDYANGDLRLRTINSILDSIKNLPGNY